LPQDRDLTGASRPAGEIRRLDSDGAAVATLPTVGVEVEKSAEVEVPVDATFVGVVSTQRYYPVNTSLDVEDLVYFSTEDEAKAQGYTAAE